MKTRTIWRIIACLALTACLSTSLHAGEYEIVGDLDVTGNAVVASNLTVESVNLGGETRSNWPSGGDHLGNHTATQELNMSGYHILNAHRILGDTNTTGSLLMGWDLSASPRGVIIYGSADIAEEYDPPKLHVSGVNSSSSNAGSLFLYGGQDNDEQGTGGSIFIYPGVGGTPGAFEVWDDEQTMDVLKIQGTAGFYNGDITDTIHLVNKAYVDAEVSEASTGVSTGDISNWDTAYTWGDHGAGGYATGTPIYVESDPDFNSSPALGITTNQILDWSAAFGWGDHAGAGYSTGTPVYAELDPGLTAWLVGGDAVIASSNNLFTGENRFGGGVFFEKAGGPGNPSHGITFENGYGSTSELKFGPGGMMIEDALILYDGGHLQQGLLLSSSETNGLHSAPIINSFIYNSPFGPNNTVQNYIVPKYNGYLAHILKTTTVTGISPYTNDTSDLTNLVVSTLNAIADQVPVANGAGEFLWVNLSDLILPGYSTGTPVYAESDPAALLPDGSRAMTGDLDLGGNSLLQVSNLTVLGSSVVSGQLEAVSISLNGDARAFWPVPIPDTALDNRAASSVVDLATNRIVNVGEPTQSQDASTKSYVDSQLASLMTFLPPQGGLSMGAFTNLPPQP